MIEKPDDCTVEELKHRMTTGNAPVVLDVREPEEVSMARIPDSIHIPMGDIPSRLTELEEYADDEVVVYCHHGMRSASVQGFLRHHGFVNVRNLVGGIDAWSLRVDQSVPRY